MIVVDASAIGALLLQDQDATFVLAVDDALATSTIYAPAHWPVEVMNLLVKSVRQGRTPADHLPVMWRRAATLIAASSLEPVKVDADLLDVAVQAVLTPRDAAYVELAARRRFTMCTADKSIIRACKSLSIKLLAPEA